MTAAGAAPRPHHRPLSGVLLIVAMGACFATMDTVVRHLGGRVPVLLMLWLRYATQAGAMLLFLLASRRHGFGTAHPRFQALRGALLLCSSAMSFIGLQFMPVAEFTAIAMLTPVLVTLLSAVLLHEAVSRGRWALVAGAMAGALVVIRPGSGLFGAAVLFPLVGSTAYAFFQVLTRRLASSEDPYTTHFYTGAVGMLAVSAVLAPALAAGSIDIGAVWQQASAGDLALLLLIGLMGTSGHLMLILALGMAPTAVLMPFIYTQIAIATLLSWQVFGRLPDAWAWVGMAMITACGAAAAWLNVRRASAPSAVEADTIAD